MKFLAKLGLMAVEIIVAYVVSFAMVIAGLAVFEWVFNRNERKERLARDQKVSDAKVEEVETEGEPVQEGTIVDSE